MKSYATQFLLALLLLGVASPVIAQTPVLGATNLVTGPAAATSSVVLADGAAWVAGANAAWLHVGAASQSGAGSTNVIFSADANAGATRVGTLTVAGQTVTITQAGGGYAAAKFLAPLVSSGLGYPVGLAVDGFGNVYVADADNNVIDEWVAASNTVVTLVSTGLGSPAGLAVDGLGNVYVADAGNNAIEEWVAASNTLATLVGTGLSGPEAVAVDGAGNVYIADTGNSAIKERVAAGQAVVTLVSAGLNQPYGVAVDAAGNVYVADTFNNAVKEWAAGGGGLTTLVGTGLSWPVGVAVDGSGNVFVADDFDSKVLEWTAASGVLTAVVTNGLDAPQGVALDGLGNVYVADTGDSVLAELPHAWVDPAALTEGTSAGDDVLPAVVPATVVLSGPFAPASDSAWLTISGVTNGVVDFGFTASPAPVRTAHLSLLGQSIAIIQSAPPTTTTLGPLVAANYGDILTFSATVAPDPGAGSVQFYANGVALGAPVAVSGGGAMYSASGFGAGTYAVTAAFGGIPTFAGSASGVAIQTVAPLPVTISAGVTANNKTYDGGLAAGLSLNDVILDGILAGDQGGVSLSTNGYSAAFATATVGDGVVVTVSGLTLVGYAAANYMLTQPSLVADINPASPTIVIAPVASSISFGRTLATSALSGGAASVPGSFAFASPSTVPGAGVTAEGVIFTPADMTDYNSVTFQITVTAVSDLAVLGTTNLVCGPAGGNDSVVLAAGSGAWSAGANNDWLHVRPGSSSDSGSTNLVFSIDMNAGATRVGTLTIAGQTLTVTQAGAAYGPAVAYTALVTAGLGSPGGVAVDGAGNVYVADSDNNAVKEWVAASNTVVTLVGAGLSGPAGVAVDGAGNVYIADTGDNAIKEQPAGGGALVTLVAAGLSSPYGVAVDGLGNVYIADTFNNAVKEWRAAGGAVVTLVGSGLNDPFGVAVDAAGNVYVADTFNNAVEEWTAADATVTTLVGAGLVWPSGVAVDGSGNVYVADNLDSKLLEWSAATGTLIDVVTNGLNSPQGVAVDGAGNPYIADTGNNQVTELPQAWVNPASLQEAAGAGTDYLPVVLPATINLTGPFAPESDAAWLTVGGITNGVVNFAFAASEVPIRAAQLSLLGQTITITQGTPTFTTLGAPATVTYGQNLDLAATIFPAPQAGTVQFYANGASLGNPAPVNGGVAAYSGAGLGVGTYAITAQFSGAPGFGISTSAAKTETVTPAEVTIIGGLTANDKPYDTTTSATLSWDNVILSGVIAGDLDSVGLSTNEYAASFASPAVATGVAVTVTGLTLTGSAAGNYTLEQPLLTADITLGISLGTLVSSENPSPFSNRVSFTATFSATATGDAVFLTNGIVFDSVPIGGGAATSTPTLLPAGPNVVTVQYAGDGNYLGVTNTLTQMVNYPPVAQTMTITQTPGVAIDIALSDLATNWSDAGGYPVELTAVDLTSTNGLAVTLTDLETNLDGAYVITNTAFLSYDNPSNVTDQISYTISDGQGDTATGLINIVAVPVLVPGPTSMAIPTANGVTVNFTGVPGDIYIMQRSTDLSNWLTVSITNAPPGGVFSFTDDFGDLAGVAPAAAYYRLGWFSQ